MARRSLFLGVQLVLVCAAAVAVATAQAAAPSFSLKISAEKPEFRVGERVHIEILQTNLTDQEIDCSYVGGGGVNRRYHYEVYDEDGHEAEKVARLGPPMADYHDCGIKPGESNNNTIILSVLYKFDRPGKYTIQVWRSDTVKDENGDDLEVRSNTIEIRITG